MKEFAGNPEFPIWLLGDSEPKNWSNFLTSPLDPKHPARHNIWTPIIENIQEKVYRQHRLRIDTSKIYIRNAIGPVDNKPKKNEIEWDRSVIYEFEKLKKLCEKYNPKFIFTFGSFAFEFARRSINETPNRKYVFWDTVSLGREFKKRMESLNINEINTIPLLHVSIARGKFLKSHKNFCNSNDNYFEYAGKLIANKLLESKDVLDIWI